MEDILCMAESMKNAIANSHIYIDYKKARERIKQDTDLELKIKNFRKKKMEYSSKALQNIELTLDEEKYISKLYFDLCLNEDAKIYLESERALIELMSKVSSILYSDLDMIVE